jgi:hypothetical protein
MIGFSGNYSHQAGDRFIFKGGVSWSNACFPLVVNGSGASNNPDYYGPDTSWFSGGSWTRPKFDAGGTAISGTVDDFIHFSASNPQSYVTFDNLDLTGLYWTGSSYTYDQVSFIHVSSSTYITIQNCYFHNWTHGTDPGTTDQMTCVFGTSNPPYNLGCVIKNCVFDGENAANQTNFQSCGGATFTWGGSTLNCVVRNMMTGFLLGTGNTDNTPVEVGFCNVGPLYRSFDQAAHPDGLQANLGGALIYIHDNLFHDSATVLMFIGGNNGERDYVWNNVFYNFTDNNPLLIDTAHNGTEEYIWNNTFVSPNYYAIRVDYRSSGGTLGVLSMINNLFIGSVSGLYSVDAPASITLVTNQNNVITSAVAASSQGYTLANLYQPTSLSGSSIGAGRDLSAVLNGALTKDILSVARPQAGRWDAGAYEYLGGSSSSQPTSPLPPSNLRIVSQP